MVMNFIMLVTMYPVVVILYSKIHVRIRMEASLQSI